MRTKKILIILVIFVGSLMLMPNSFGATNPPITWAGQATLSPTGDSCIDQDPENSGFGTVQVVVWEHEGANSWDIYMNYSLSDGAAGTWSSPITQPAASNMDEINPAVCVTRNHTGAIGQEIHVVYERTNAQNIKEICHVYTSNYGTTWSGVTILSTANVDSTNPACVYTEDLAPGPGGAGVIGFLCQVVWEEDIGSGNKQIMYDAFVYDPTWGARGTLTGGPFVIRTPPSNCKSELPEIASVDERANNSAYNYPFSIVWQETNSTGGYNIWYTDGITSTSPSVSVTLTAGSTGRINPLNASANHKEPDIAATQDYQLNEVFYFHIDYVKIGTGTPTYYYIVSHYSRGIVYTPGAASFTQTPTVWGPNTTVKDRPTIASKLRQIGPSFFDTWFAWEESRMPGSMPNIWYRVGQHAPGPGFTFLVPAAKVPITPVGQADNEYNPELWNRNEALRSFPPLTHLVLDLTIPGTSTEVEYIDP